jgi:protein tyrosine/serine phosphatase
VRSYYTLIHRPGRENHYIAAYRSVLYMHMSCAILSDSTCIETATLKKVSGRTIPLLTLLLPIGLCLLTSGCVYISKHTLRGACLTDMGSPVRNFCVVAPRILWRGERPTKEDARWLLEQRVGTVVSLQLEDQRAFEKVALSSDYSHSVTYYRVSGFSPVQLLSPAHLDEHLALFIAIVKASPKPVYVHCRAGVDRTGILAAAYRVLVDGAARSEAVAEMGRYHSPWQDLDARYIYGLSETRREKILRDAADWQSRLSPTARIECAGGRCTFVHNPNPVGGKRD